MSVRADFLVRTTEQAERLGVGRAAAD